MSVSSFRAARPATCRHASSSMRRGCWPWHQAPTSLSIRAALDTLPAICAGGEAAGPLKHLSARERFDWLVAPRSSSIQTSPVHTGRGDDLDAVLERLLRTMVRA